jgi:hypothetical protein
MNTIKTFLISAIVLLSCVGYANAGKWTTIDAPRATRTYIYGISGGNIVGRYDDDSGDHIFLYNGSSWTTLDILPTAGHIFPTGISGNNIV